MEALPIERRELRKISRKYIANCIYTITGKPFADWVDVRIEERNQMRKDEKDVSVVMDPEIAAIFKASTAISLSKGISNNMMKVSNATHLAALFSIFSWNRQQLREGELERRFTSKSYRSRSRSSRLTKSWPSSTKCQQMLIAWKATPT